MLQTSHKTEKNIRIVFLDYLRIFALASVLIGHTFHRYLEALPNNLTVHPTPRLLASLLPHFFSGGAGIVVFFLISGYIITHVLQTEGATEFLIKRTFRIYPLYIITLLAQYITLVAIGKAPNLSVLLPQLLLVGDFFGTPYALNGVEWTLRVEVIFYVFMAALRSLNLMTKYKKILPYILIATNLLCCYIAPFPSNNTFLGQGFVTTYGLFLLLGVMFYIFEKKQIGLTFLLFFIGLTFYQHYSQIVIYQKAWLDPKYWLDCHFQVMAFIVFVVAWTFRMYAKENPAVLFLASMTYAVYLLHNWFFDYAKKYIAFLNISVLHPDVQVLIVLLLVSFFMVRYIEKPGIQFGRFLLTKL